ncbi:MAG: hypothetical protein ACREDU_05905, partial [Methylocella sp.]
PHAVDLPAEGRGARMLMIFQPSGFDQYLAELGTMTDADFQDKAKMDALNDKYDIVNLGDVPARIT